ncbi:MAG: aspartate ammonia-lyase, partial [Ghiorsea sp.]|nr:aspartate ammonia-lyase [Ghiorsea sp.]
GTSTNMNVNEVIANISLELLGKKLGEYEYIHPINHVNLHQSTNDTFPTAVKIACIKEIRKLASSYSKLQKSFQEKESEYGNVLKLARTEYMDALPILAGQMFGAYGETVSRDRWRIYKVEERLRTINIGGTAIGTGLNAPLKYTFMMTSMLQDSTNIGLSRAESLIDNTQNLDSFNEVSSLLKVAAATLIKISNDLRFLASGPSGGIGEIILKDNQVGSSIMPGKVNPVIAESMAQVCAQVIGNDAAITFGGASGLLDLNVMLPMMAHNLLESEEILANAAMMFTDKCIVGLTANIEKCEQQIEWSMSMVTSLAPVIGYDKASDIAKRAVKEGKTVRQLCIDENILPVTELDTLLDPRSMLDPHA